jgi:hypothetical protein
MHHLEKIALRRLHNDVVMIIHEHIAVQKNPVALMVLTKVAVFTYNITPQLLMVS